MKLFISFCGEGATDQKIFKNLTERIVKDILLNREISAEISWMPIKKNGTSEASLLNAAKEAKEQGFLVYHRDADCDNRAICLEKHFNSGLEKINQDENDIYCKKIVLAIPIHETESWMLCNKEFLKDLIETTLSNTTLQLTYQINRIESVADPKQKIENAITIHRNSLPARKRRQAVQLSDLYEPFGQDVDISDLMNINSFQVFHQDIKAMIENIIDG